MKRIIYVNKAATSTDIGLLIARMGIAALMLTHGIPKMMMLFSGTPVQFPPVMELSAELSLGLTVFTEVFCSLFLLMGLATRLATIPLIITMLVAVFYIHMTDTFAKQELAIMYLLSYVVLFITGSGRYSVDYLLHRRSLNPISREQIEDPTLSIYNF